MKILIPTIGTRGDVQPYIALSPGLQEAGHQVTLASHPVMESLVVSYGIRFQLIGPDVDVGRLAEDLRDKSRNWLLGLIRVMRFTLSIIEQASPDVLSLCRETDWVVVTHSFISAAEADKLGKPTVSVTLQPQAIPRADGGLISDIVGRLMTRPYNRLRRRIGGPTVNGVGDMMSRRLNLIPISPRVVPRDPRWASQHRLSGYWFLDEPHGWTPPEELQAFLSAGEPPVAVSLGAMSLGGGPQAREAAHVVLNAIRQTGVRAVVQGWDEVIHAADLPEGVFLSSAVPHSWLFERVSCVVHHRGFGTTAAALRAGVPSVIVPHIIDQTFWGQRVYELGVGLRPVPDPALSVEKMAQALIQATRDNEMRKRAAQLGAQIRAEAGVQRAVQWIEDVMQK